MEVNPALGLVLHWIGGLAAASFYLAYRGVRGWSWETYWLVGGVFSWLVVPWLLALSMTRDLFGVLAAAPTSDLLWTFFFGVLWGFGGLTFGLAVRYLGLSLGYAMVLGYSAAFGTLLPPIVRGDFLTAVLATSSGRVVVGGVLVCLVGIAVTAAAGRSREQEVATGLGAPSGEFAFRRGLLVATFSGIMSACFAYALAAGDSIKALTVARGTGSLWQGLPVLVIVLAGGFTTNAVWCVALNRRRRTSGEYIGRPSGLQPAPLPPPPLLVNYALCAVAGTTWYLQFFFYTMGETQMGRFAFSSWTLHMASIIIFSTLWGIALGEWSGTRARTRRLVATSLLVLIASTVIVGYGNYLTSR